MTDKHQARLDADADQMVEDGRAMTHDEALDLIVGTACTVTTLSYQEAIEGYLKLRGITL